MKTALAPLNEWEPTRDALHQAMQVIRSTSVLGRDSLPNQIEYSGFVTLQGVTTGPLNFGGELEIQYENLAVVYMKDDTEIFRVPLKGHTQRSLFNAVFTAFREHGVELSPDSGKVVGNTVFNIDPDTATEYAGVQFRIARAMTLFRSRLSGTQTPLVIWPHGFDISFIWFVSGFDEKKDPHINFGFVPGTGDIRPYFYLYAWPVPEGLIGKKPLPRNGTWIEQWSTPGACIPYDAFISEADPEQAIMETYLELFHMIAPMMERRSL